jgi:DNA-binding transcriptional ArsR family regulator
MSDRRTVLEEMETLTKALENFPAGASIEDIESHTNLDLSRRALQRRLMKLQELGVVRAEGKTRGVRYFLIERLDRKTPSDLDESLIPLSKAGKAIQDLVNRPLQKRAPIGYNRGFLELYQPNESAYLTRSEIEKLTNLGKVAPSEQLAGTYAKQLLSRFLVDLSWNSSRLEGNTYSLLDTQRLIDFGETVGDKSNSEAQMILNHKDAIEFLVRSPDEIRFNRYTVLNLHALLANNLLPDPSAVGRLRTISVGISQAVYTPPAVPQTISEVFNLILEKADQIIDPFEQAFFVMVQLSYLQPFDDVNKRVSRLAANIPFIRHTLAPLSFVDVPDQIYIQGTIGVYELNRIDLLKDVFLWAYERSAARYAVLRQSLGEPDPFRLKYRHEISWLITSIVTKAMTSQETSFQIKDMAQDVPEQDREKFIETVETELLSLHEGSIARYQIRPAQFEAWKKVWGTVSSNTRKEY